MKTKTTYHVQNGSTGSWEIRKDSAVRATKTFDTKEDAYQFGRQLCDENRPSELVVHQQNGQIADRSLYNE
ncbi:DUF2188 domain-containing protein [Pseudalkalibacillus hwajinpoensis]|uniref:DUF2188 domain-containing protein n=1 Tax=Guptibacillus hwajinpoensis TaxID=208199 RepID=UPI001CFC837B|nr:DUF2188 domain-containing protein [Pseudalkalibacillus hwajinpoensis]